MAGDIFSDQKTFMSAFGMGPADKLSYPDRNQIKLWLSLIREEIDELFAAVEKTETLFNNKRGPVDDTITRDKLHALAAVLDGGIDSIYVIAGLLNLFGFPCKEAWDEVHRTNMSKLGEDGKPIRRADGKILKPAGWRPPDLVSLLTKGASSGKESRV